MQRGDVASEGEPPEEDRKMPQNNDEEGEEEGKGLSLGWWEVVLRPCRGSDLPAQSRREEKERL